MSKKGFTLVELLAVIVILAIIMAIAIPAVQNTISSSKDKLYNLVVKQIEDAAKQYMLKSSASTEIPTGPAVIGLVHLSDLIDGGFLEGTVQNPKTGLSFSPLAGVWVEVLANGNLTYEFSIDGNDPGA